jgi:molybdopterin-guanine dinucleotide biosynthesis protein A
MIRKINASLKERLKEGNMRVSKTLQNKKGNTITACSLERVQCFDNIRNFLLRK